MPSPNAAPAVRPDGLSPRRAAAIYGGTALAVIALFYGPFLCSDRVGILDWSKDLYYFAFLYDSLRSFGCLPLSFLAIPDATTWFSTLQNLSYWSNPEVISFSPLLPLVFVLPFMVFLKTYFGLHLLAAAWGVRVFARRCGFGLGRSIVLLVLFLGNPWLVQHLAIGYSPQISLCLVPGVAALLAAPEFRPREWAGASLLAACILYQGALHLFVWLFMAIGVFVLFDALLRRRLSLVWRTGFLALATAVLVAPKIYAVKKVYGSWQRIPAGGYASLADLWGLLTDASFPMFRFPETYSHHNVAFYDGSLLVGPALPVLVALLAGGYLFARFRRRPPLSGHVAADGACLLAALTFLVLGWGTVWRTVCVGLHLPSSEIYPFRFLFIAYHFAIFFLVDRLGDWPAGGTLRRLRLGACYALLGLTCLTFWGRNRELMPYLTENPNFYGAFSIAEFMSNRIVALSGTTRLPVVVSPNRITITPPGRLGDPIDLPWLPRAEAGQYRIRAARPVADAPGPGTRLTVTAAARPVVLVPDDSHRLPLCAAALALFAGLTLVVDHRVRQGPRPDPVSGRNTPCMRNRSAM